MLKYVLTELNFYFFSRYRSVVHSNRMHNVDLFEREW